LAVLVLAKHQQNEEALATHSALPFIVNLVSEHKSFEVLFLSSKKFAINFADCFIH